LRETGLRQGDYFRLEVRPTGAEVEIIAQVVGVVDYFPSWTNSEDGPLFVGNLDSLFQQMGGELPYEVWLRTTAAFNDDDFGAALRARGLYGWYWQEPYGRIGREQLRPERQGMFGLLTVGFAAAAILTIVGFFLYALFSFRNRAIELGILRAVGLTGRQTLLLVGGELGLLVGSGLGLGAAVGAWISQLTIPALQAAGANPTPPYLVEIAWPAIIQVTLLFAAIWLIALVGLGLLLRRVRIFEAVKLGETV
jgi:putative ABC transport system permease protein